MNGGERRRSFALSPGAEIAGHRIVSQIGRGGMGVVYLAEHLSLERMVALKVLAPEFDEDPNFRARFVRERKLAAVLDHPNVVTVYDAGDADGVLYISMRYVEGTDLSRRLREAGTLSAVEALSALVQVASALDAAHAVGLVHRDVKPANVLLAERPAGRAFLTDFGLTRRAQADPSGPLTMTGQFVGTIDYVAPEQITGGSIDGRTDQYSLGCLLYQCLSGRAPFDRDSDIAVIYAHLQDPPPPVSAVRPDLPASLDVVMARAMAKEKEDRFDTCEEFVTAVRDALVEAGVVDRGAVAGGPGPGGAGTVPVAGVPATRVIGGPGAPPEGPAGRPGRRRAWVLAAIPVVLAAAIGAALVLRGNGATTTTSTRGPASPSTTPAGPSATGIAWTRDVTDAAVFGGPGNQVMNRVIGVGPGLVAVGYDAPTGANDPAVWTSADGRTWQRQDAVGLQESGDQGMAAVAAGGPGLVAVGTETFGGNSRAAVWTSSDGGRTWTRVDPTQSAFSGPGSRSMTRIIAAASGLVAVGSATTPQGLDAAVWTSPDGTTWARTTGTALGGPGDQEMRSVTRFGSGNELVAVGSETIGSDRNAAAWLFDGTTWKRADRAPLDGPGQEQMMSVVAFGKRLVAVGIGGSTSDEDAAAWTSSDGLHWTPVPPDPAAFGGPGDQEMIGLAAGGPGLVAVGFETDNGDVNGAVWTSPDGLHWTRVPPTQELRGVGDQVLKSVVAVGSEFVAVGDEVTDRNANAAVWNGQESAG